MKFTELQHNTDPIHYIIHTLFIDSIVDDEEAENLEVVIEEIPRTRNYSVTVDDTDDPMGYGIHTSLNIYLGEYSAIADIFRTNGDPLLAVFQYKNPIPFHVEYIHK